MGGAVKAVGNAVSSITGGGGDKGPSAAEVAAATITAQNNAAAAAKANAPSAAPTLSAGQGMGGPGGNRKGGGVGANMLTGSLGDTSSNATATKKLLGS